MTEHGADRYENPLLHPQERKACEMYFNGFSRREIADELDISPEQLRTLFCRARRCGVPIPRLSNCNTQLPPHKVQTTRLVELREQLSAPGKTKREVDEAIAERTGLTRNNVTVRLWNWDRAQKAKTQERAA